MPEMESIGAFAVWYIVFLLALTLHEGAHALAAWMGGDDTAYRGGQATLNPWPHIQREPFGTVGVPLITYLASGWMMGWASTPYDPIWARRYPRRSAIMSAAGPAANLLLAAIAFFIIKALLGAGTFAAPENVNFSHVVEPSPGTAAGSFAYPLAFCLSIALNLNVLLFLFNLIPLPPLDGSGVLQGLMPDTFGRFVETMARNPMFSIMGLLVAWRLLDFLYGPAFAIILKLLYPELAYS